MSSSPKSERRNETAVLEAQIDHLYTQLPRLLAYSALVSLMLAIMLRNAVPLSHSIGWLSGMMITIISRLILHRRYQNRRKSQPVRLWARLYVLFSGISGIAWGLAGILLFAPERLELQSLILLVLAGMGAGSASILPMYLPAFYVFLPSMMFPVGVMMILHGGQFHYFMAVFDFVFLFGVLAFGRAIGRAFNTSLRLRFENIELVEQLEIQKEELLKANQAKSRFLAAASHDLRQPLHALSLFSEILRQDSRDAQTLNHAENIRASVGVLERLFSSLLDISRIDAGILKAEPEDFEVSDIISRICTDGEAMAKEKNLAFVVNVEPALVRTDPTLFERILRNLVSNAIRYTETGRVEVIGRNRQADFELQIIDTGVGIPQDSQELVFEEFTQLENPERDRTKGLGLGLSIVRRLTDMLDLPLQMESEREKGTTFILRVPRSTASKATVSASTFPTVGSTDRLGLRVLVIDDDPDILHATSDLLSSWGCQVWTAKSMDNAKSVAQSEQPFDALVTDLRLPDNTRGTEVVQMVRAIHGKQTPALLITGDTETASTQEAREAGLELLYKPVQPARLRAWLRNRASTSV